FDFRPDCLPLVPKVDWCTASAGRNRGSQTMPQSRLIAVDSNTIPWEERFNERIGRALFRKELFTDPETGVEIRLVRYPAGVINPEHTHPCGHGMYVLEGTLVTHTGRFGPGSFVW